MIKDTINRSGTVAVGLFAFLLFAYTPSSWAGKSLWELRGQVKEESSQGETTQDQQKKITSTDTESAIESTPKEVNPEMASFIDSVTVPNQYGRVKERYVGTDSSLFVLLQEIHNHPEVQKNNVEIIKVLLDQYQIPLILAEGNYGPLVLKNLLAQPKEWIEKHAKEKLESGYYTAEEYLYLTREPHPIVIGVDDEKIVKEQYDLVHYQFLIENGARAEAIFSQLEQAVEPTKSKLYSVALKSLDVSSQEYSDDKISAEEFTSILNEELKEQGKTLSEAIYPNVALIVKAAELEKEDKYEESQEFSQKVDHSKLFAEIRGLEKGIRSKLYRSSKEETLARLAKGLYYFEKLSKISLIPLEWEEYIQELSPFTVTALVNFLKENGITVSATTSEEIAFLDQYRKEGETFYQIAIDRERTMVENSLTALTKHGVNKAILKTGGFHTTGISQFLRANGISYVVIAPKVTQPNMPTPYQEILKKTMGNFSKTTAGNITAMSMAQQRAVPSVIQENQNTDADLASQGGK